MWTSSIALLSSTSKCVAHYSMKSSSDAGSGGGGDGSPRRRHNARAATSCSPDVAEAGRMHKRLQTGAAVAAAGATSNAVRSPRYHRPKNGNSSHQRRSSSTALFVVLILMVSFVLAFLALVAVRAQWNSNDDHRNEDTTRSGHRDATPSILGRGGRTGTNAKHQMRQFHSSVKQDDTNKRKRRTQIQQNHQQQQEKQQQAALSKQTEDSFHYPIAISIDAGSLSISSSGYEKAQSVAKLQPFGSAMMENDEPEHTGESQTDTALDNTQAWTTGKPNAHAKLSDGKIDVLQRRAAWEDECEPLPVWQRTFRPVCNVVHEIDLDVRDVMSSASKETDTTLLSAGGSWRMAWKIRPKATYLDIEEAGETRRAYLVEKFNSIPELLPPKEKKNCTSAGTRFNIYGQSVNCTNSDEEDDESDGIDDADYGHSMVLKMLRIDRPYNEEAFYNNQVDVMAMDRFTASPFVIDAYGFCGMSVMTEVAGGSGRDLVKRTDIEPKKRLRIARNLAMGLSQIHGDREGRAASLVHNDLNLENLVLVKTSTIKFNDFNIAVMNRRRKDTEKSCGHPVLFESPLWRSPEEIRDDGGYVDEKIDIYSFGNILFQILTKHQPWTWLELEKPSIEEIAKKKMRGELPRIPEKYTESENMAEQALYIATMMCYAFDPAKRPSAWQLANALAKAHKEFAAFKKGKRKDLTFDELQKIFGLDKR